MRVYLAGPMRNRRAYNLPAFWRAALDLRKMGYEVVSPAEIDVLDGMVEITTAEGEKIDFSNPACYEFDFDTVDVILSPLYTFQQAMRRDIQSLCGCDGITLLSGWSESEGALIELQVARWCGIKIYEYRPGEYLVERP